MGLTLVFYVFFSRFWFFPFFCFISDMSLIYDEERKRGVMPQQLFNTLMTKLHLLICYSSFIYRYVYSTRTRFEFLWKHVYSTRTRFEFLWKHGFKQKMRRKPLPSYESCILVTKIQFYSDSQDSGTYSMPASLYRKKFLWVCDERDLQPRETVKGYFSSFFFSIFFVIDAQSFNKDSFFFCVKWSMKGAAGFGFRDVVCPHNLFCHPLSRKWCENIIYRRTNTFRLHSPVKMQNVEN